MIPSHPITQTAKKYLLQHYPIYATISQPIDFPFPDWTASDQVANKQHTHTVAVDVRNVLTAIDLQPPSASQGPKMQVKFI